MSRSKNDIDGFLNSIGVEPGQNPVFDAIFDADEEAWERATQWQDDVMSIVAGKEIHEISGGSVDLISACSSPLVAFLIGFVDGKKAPLMPTDYMQENFFTSSIEMAISVLMNKEHRADYDPVLDMAHSYREYEKFTMLMLLDLVPEDIGVMRARKFILLHRQYLRFSYLDGFDHGQKAKTE